MVLSIETNKNYYDTSRWQQRVVYSYSSDSGKTWDSPVTICQDPAGRIFHWDQRAAVSADGKLVTFTWTYDRNTAAYLNIQRRISVDEGKTWSQPADLGFADQPSHPAMLPDGRVVLAWVDRYQTKSIRTRLSKGIDAPLLPETEVVLHEFQSNHHGKDFITSTGELLTDMNEWAFGLPYAEVLPDGDVLVVYYSGSQTCMNIHWARLSSSTKLQKFVL